jgi:uncharacterized protein YbjT (DUF2867 family)
VRVIVRDAKKEQEWKSRGADVVVADLDDEGALAKALAGAEGAYLLLPPSYGSAHVRSDYAKRSAGYARAFDASGVKHVVFLSSIGAELDGGTGPIATAHDAEAALGKTRADVTFLRAAYFMENWGGSLFALAQGLLPTFLTQDRAIPMVATADIGEAAARLLLEGGRGKRVVEIAGPREYSPKDVAAALAGILGKPIATQQAPEEAMPAALTGAGMNAEWAGLFQEMTHGMNTGKIGWQAGHTRIGGRVGVEKVLAGLVRKSA